MYRVDDEMLQTLDDMENLYERKCVPVTIVTRESIDAQQSSHSVDEKGNAIIKDCQMFLVENFRDELLTSIFWDKYDAVGNPQHRLLTDTPLEDMSDKEIDHVKNLMKKTVFKS